MKSPCKVKRYFSLHSVQNDSVLFMEGELWKHLKWIERNDSRAKWDFASFPTKPLRRRLELSSSRCRVADGNIDLLSVGELDGGSAAPTILGCASCRREEQVTCGEPPVESSLSHTLRSRTAVRIQVVSRLACSEGRDVL